MWLMNRIQKVFNLILYLMLLGLLTSFCLSYATKLERELHKDGC